MTDAFLVLALGASSLAALSFLLSRLIPDHYDRANPAMSLSVQAVDRPRR